MRVHDLDIEQLKRFDPREWERLQAEYHDRVFGYVKRQVVDRDIASDLTQETFLGAVRGIANFNTRKLAPLQCIEQMASDVRVVCFVTPVIVCQAGMAISLA